jgi:stage IV sporulation protein FA
VDEREIRFRPSRRQWLTQFAICIMIYVLILILFRVNTPWTLEAKRFVHSSLTDDIRFEAVAAWYDQTFSGTPTFFPAFRTKHHSDNVIAPAGRSLHMPVEGEIAEAYATGHPFVLLQTIDGAAVASIDHGIVLSAGLRESMGYVVTIRHTGGFVTTYGGMRPGKWTKDQWITAGEVIGQVARAGEERSGAQRVGLFYFTVMKDGLYVDPTDVISFD